MFMQYMTDYAGLGAWGASLATILLLVARLFDAVDDPIQGFIMDSGKVGKHGQYKPFFMISIITVSYTHLDVYKRQSLNSYIRLVRLRRAQNLLEGTDREITEIAYTCGFGSLSNFYRVFQDLTGQSPGEYRRQRRPPTPEPVSYTHLDHDKHKCRDIWSFSTTK